jgi:homocysteine S-methyltransferase
MLLLDGGSTSIARFLPTPTPSLPAPLSSLWTSAYSLIYPSAVKQWHLSFLRAGSDIITTNTYQIPLPSTVPEVDIRAVVRAAVQLAVDSTEQAGRGAVALSFGTLNSNFGKGEYSVEPRATVDEYASYHREKVLLFHGALGGLWERVEYLAFETLSSFEEADAIMSAINDLKVKSKVEGKKVWMTFSCGDASIPRLRDIISRTVKSPNISTLWGIGVNCVGIDIVHDLAEMIGEEIAATPLTLVVYPDAGSWRDRTTAQFTYDAPALTNEDVGRWAEVARELQSLNGEKVVLGGCCNTDPRFIEKLHLNSK